MHVDGFIVLGSAIVGLLVGMTGAGGGALMTPMLIFLFGVTPTAAISSDLVAAIFMRPVGAAVHLKRGTVNMRMVGWLAIGTVPSAFFGAYLLHLMGGSTAAETDVEIVLGSALLVGAAGMLARTLWRRQAQPSGAELLAGDCRQLEMRPLLTVLVGVVGGVMVGLTSVGSGSLMIVLLLFVYPALGSSQLVGTDLVQAIPLTAAAALGQLVFGHVVLAVTASVVIGSVPAVLVGSLLSSRAPDRLIRPVITGVIIVSGLKYVGLDTTGLGVAVAVVAVGCVAWVLTGWRNERRAAGAGAGAPVPPGPVAGDAGTPAPTRAPTPAVGSAPVVDPAGQTA